MRRLLYLALLLLAMPSFGATTHYISKSLGADTNAGTTKGAPWAHMPGMASCTNTCGSYTPGSGDQFILYGGDTWVSSDLGVNWTWSGTSVNPIYIGVDQTWFNSVACGASWCRPIWTCGGGTCGNSSQMVKVGGSSNIGQWTVWDNIEMTGKSLSNDFGYFQNYADNVTVKNMYVHGWSHTGETGDNGYAFTSTTCCGASGVGMVFDHNVVDGSDTTKDALACFFSLANVVSNNVCNYATNGIEAAFDDAHGNIIMNLIPSFAAGAHQNAIFNFTNASASNIVIYNNFVWHTFYNGSTQATGSGGGIWMAGNGAFTGTGYVFNNVLSENATAFNLSMGGHNALNYGTWYVFNQTQQCGNDGNMSDDCGDNIGGAAGMTFNLHGINNHCLTASGTGNCFTCAFSISCSFTTQKSQTLSAASGQGYTPTSTYAFQPTSGSGATIGTGTNEQSLCTTIAAFNSAAGTACQKDVAYPIYDSVNHVVTSRTPNPRPASTAWDIGAYQFGASQPTQPASAAQVFALNGAGGDASESILQFQEWALKEAIGQGGER